MKQCKYCGKVMEDDCAFCPACGSEANSAAHINIPYQIIKNNETLNKSVNALGVAAMVIGIVTWFISYEYRFNYNILFCYLVGFVLSIVALCMRKKYRLNGFAIAGLVINICGLFYFLWFYINYSYYF